MFARQLFGLGAAGTGLLNTANAVGGIIGAFAVFFTARFGRKGLLSLIGTLIYAVFLIAFGFNKSFPLGLVIVGVLGMTDTLSMTMRSTILQLTTPDQLLGRASAIGAGSTMVIGGVLSVVFVLTVWRFVPGIRNYRYNNLR
jgi:MFS family permease